VFIGSIDRYGSSLNSNTTTDVVFIIQMLISWSSCAFFTDGADELLFFAEIPWLMLGLSRLDLFQQFSIYIRD
jgi:hypothetical protein